MMVHLFIGLLGRVDSNCHYAHMMMSDYLGIIGKYQAEVRHLSHA